MKSKLLELLNNQNWMIHDLVDGGQIENDEEENLYKLYLEAKDEFDEIFLWLHKTKNYLDENDVLASNSFAKRALDEIMKKFE